MLTIKESATSAPDACPSAAVKQWFSAREDGLVEDNSRCWCFSGCGICPHGCARRSPEIRLPDIARLLYKDPKGVKELARTPDVEPKRGRRCRGITLTENPLVPVGIPGGRADPVAVEDGSRRGDRNRGSFRGSGSPDQGGLARGLWACGLNESGGREILA